MVARRRKRYFAKNIQLADLVADIGREMKVTPAQVALAWLISQKVSMIPGTRKVERLEENWASQELSLKAEHLEKLDSLIDQGVTGARY